MTTFTRGISFRRRAAALAILLAGWFAGPPAVADQVVEVPVLAAIRANNLGVFEVLLMWWDEKPEPVPIALQWINAGVRFKGTHLGAMSDAFLYALRHTPPRTHTGMVSVQGVAYRPTSSDGPSAGAAMAVGFIAVLRGDHILRGIAMTGTLQPDGHIGPVGAIPDKVRAAAREGYRTVLIPEGQLYAFGRELTSLALELNLTLKEVGTIAEAYPLMTGRPF